MLPTDSPHLAKSAFAMALSPMLWAQHKPDRFDSWSAGIVLLQLCLPPVRMPRGLNLFKVEYERAGYDLQRWRDGCRWLTRRDTAVLDADDGAGGGVCEGGGGWCCVCVLMVGGWVCRAVVVVVRARRDGRARGAHTCVCVQVVVVGGLLAPWGVVCTHTYTQQV